MSRSTATIVGREVELEALAAFVEPPGRALVLIGGPGAGKTTLWEAGIDAARQRGLPVLVARPSAAEARLAFAALVDLFDAVDAGALADLPPPQLRALEVALLRAEPGDAPTDSPAISLGFLNALRTLSTGSPLLVAIDDVQWLDPASADVLAFAARRLAGAPVSFLLARRPGPAAGLEQGLEPERVEVGPLSLGVIRRLLAERLGLSLSRHVLRRLVDSVVPVDSIATHLSDADVAAYTPRDDDVQRVAMPNRLFEYLHARLPIVVSDLGEIGRFVSEIRIGEVCEPDDDDACAEAIRKALEDPARYTRNRQELIERWSWEAQEDALRDIYSMAMR